MKPAREAKFYEINQLTNWSEPKFQITKNGSNHTYPFTVQNKERLVPKSNHNTALHRSSGRVGARASGAPTAGDWIASQLATLTELAEMTDRRLRNQSNTYRILN